eukprot:PhF_6_TR42932/c0_g3_i4/m.65164
MYVENSQGVFNAAATSTTTIRNLTVVGSRGGMQLNAGASLSIDMVYFKESDTVLDVRGMSVVDIQHLTIIRCYSNQTIVVRNFGIVAISSMSVENVTSKADGGVFAVYDDASLRVVGGELSVVNSTTLHGNGGVLYCNTSKVCELGGIVGIQGAMSREGLGGIVSTGIGSSGNVTITCSAKQGNPNDNNNDGDVSIEGSSGGLGGCFHVGGSTSSLTISGCRITCVSCSNGNAFTPLYPGNNLLYAPYSVLNSSVRFNTDVLTNVNQKEILMYVPSNATASFGVGTSTNGVNIVPNFNTSCVYGQPTKVPNRSETLPLQNQMKIRFEASSGLSGVIIMTDSLAVMSGGSTTRTSIPTLVGLLDTECFGGRQTDWMQHRRMDYGWWYFCVHPVPVGVPSDTLRYCVVCHSCGP